MLKCIQRFVDERDFWPILVAVVIGLALVLGALCWFEWACCGYRTGLCQMARTDPPWLFLTGIAAAPSAMLTWYWRVSHRKIDLRQKDKEHEVKERELEGAEKAARQAYIERGRADIRAAMQTLYQPEPESYVALVAIETISKQEELAAEALAALTASLRYNQTLSAAAQEKLPTLRRKAVSIVLEIRKSHPTFELDLHGAHLSGLDLRDADFRNADLRDANLTDCRLEGAMFDGAQLADVKANGATMSRPKGGSVEHLELIHGGAREVEDSEPKTREPA